MSLDSRSHITSEVSPDAGEPDETFCMDNDPRDYEGACESHAKKSARGLLRGHFKKFGFALQGAGGEESTAGPLRARAHRIISSSVLQVVNISNNV